ncbi:uncharacterized protein LOC106172777 [Lingula anatina]|uniref:Uncharacterized protein LOC106172777 n=1 Tax=Lingula anatina TaxID=7574 RepID=A0A1S3JFK3_LINAN|nr:uncharacterized protein LOC106172777 [Lingula anatina]XP_013409117.1 uncharacterized protein LOC106172777 [Lingula anatina]XP_013409118.1 uncharacterized protein LOC106172777 [Lingula anatina]XP_013409119.1 uncharacterized protein LOC106172777 [Lingula anatina]XP_013409120.1 uncharacterized protein LOC106172777 [Lingula anatina]XP_013409121.1 uncharacterized protein LOC106172777 [Lingula anatina]XP_013409122.1 uncharacterized protein LOC106172777 [Lingula anatina]XP_013409123.1 uncharacte|eukprot:XP_013409116.1 uncharacterized protein LOC106172777 [Lingula anatina]
MPRHPNIFHQRDEYSFEERTLVEKLQNLKDSSAYEETTFLSKLKDLNPSSLCNFNKLTSVNLLIDENCQTHDTEMTTDNKMKSSRRKQSKPIRVSQIELEGTEQEATAVLPQSCDLPKDDGKDDTAMEVELLGCDHCSETFTTEDDLESHVHAAHQSTENFPTAYHRLGNELQQGMGMATPSEAEPAEQGVEPDSQVIEASSQVNGQDDAQPLDMSTSSQPEEGEVARSGNRIFHPEAYCGLCDREFCNKYFLKTHKANKHGIFEGSPPGYPPTGQSFPVFPGTMPPATMLEQTNVVSSAATSTMEEQETKSPQPNQNQPTAQESSSNATPQRPTKVQVDLEDYCEICQKHFCNKYYLKKHKLDVHGIKPENQKTVSINNLINLPNESNPATSGIGQLGPMMMPPTSMGNVMFISPFLPPMGLIPTQPLLQPISQPTSLAVLNPPTSQQQSALAPNTQQQQQQQHQQQPNTTTTMATSSSLPAPVPNDALRSMGVLNADAYCEICRKEFCNKYFLKIHKANKHGIQDDVRRSSGGPGLPFPLPPMPMTPLPPGFQFMPIKQEMDGIPPPQVIMTPEGVPLLIPHSQPLPMQFRNEELAFHQTAAQNSGKNTPVPADSTSGKSTPKSESNQSGPGMNTMFSNMVMSKMADRVMCELCNKEVCNKYFLKLHRMKIHGIEPPEQSKTDSNDSFSSDGKQASLVQKVEQKPPQLLPSALPSPSQQNNLQASQQAQQIHQARQLQEARHVQEAQQLQKAKQIEQAHQIQLAQQKQIQEVQQQLQEAQQKQEEQQQGPSHTTEELIKMGIDPEAYCEICKKEFCSKYFLRTHKLNIHGIRVQKPPETTKKSPISSLALKPVHVSPFKIKSEGNEIPEQISWRWKESPSSVNPRVMCDLCNKELCNKYFLRTHKLNKHGIYEDSPSSASSTPKSTSESFGVDFSTPKSEVTMPTFSNQLNLSNRGSGSPVSNSGALRQPTSNLPLSVPTPHQQPQGTPKADDSYFSHFKEVCRLCDRRFKSAKWLTSHLVSDHGMQASQVESQFINGQSAAQGRQFCHLCGEVCADKASLDLHMTREHENSLSSQASDTPMKATDQPAAEPVNLTKQFRPTVSSNLASAIGLSLKRKYSKNMKHKLYSCSHCEYKTRWLSNIYSHEERKHKSSKDMKKYNCNECLRSFRYEHSLIRHLEQYHQNGVADPDKAHSNASSPTVNHVGGKAKKFRCAHCKDCFPSKLMCFAHIRSAHGRQSHNGGSALERPLPKMKIFSCSLCEYKTKFQSNLFAHRLMKHKLPGSSKLQILNKENHISGDDEGKSEEKMEVDFPNDEPIAFGAPCDLAANLVMQSFTMTQVDENDLKQFVPSTVYLPVSSRITEPLTVTFNLKPTEQ